MLRRHLTLAALAVASMTATGLAGAQPAHQLLDKPLRIVVGFPPGGSADTLARALAFQLDGIAPAVIVENKPGAGGRLALDYVKNADADGSTVVLTPASMMVLYPHIYGKLSYKPGSDFVAVARVAAAPFVLSVGPAVPTTVKTLDELTQWFKANPDRATYGTSGAGSMPHFTGVALGKSMGVELRHVPYKGAAPAMLDLIGGQVAANLSIMSNALAQIQSGKVRALAVTSPARVAALPQTPTLAELGHAGSTAVEWFGVFAPAKTPAPVVSVLNKAIIAALRTTPYRDALAKGSFEAVPAETPEAFAAAMQADINRWGPVVKASGFKAED